MKIFISIQCEEDPHINSPPLGIHGQSGSENAKNQPLVCHLGIKEQSEGFAKYFSLVLPFFIPRHAGHGNQGFIPLLVHTLSHAIMLYFYRKANMYKEVLHIFEEGSVPRIPRRAYIHHAPNEKLLVHDMVDNSNMQSISFV